MNALEHRENIIKNFFEGYNQFEVDKTISDFDEEITFENISNGEVNLFLEGVDAQKAQAGKAKEYFCERTQTIKEIKHYGDKSEVKISYMIGKGRNAKPYRTICFQICWYQGYCIKRHELSLHYKDLHKQV